MNRLCQNPFFFVLFDCNFCMQNDVFKEVPHLESFTMEIAGLVVGVQPMFQSTQEYCRPYLSDKTPDFLVTVTPEDLVFQQALLEQEAVEKGIKIRKFKDPFLERATIQRKVADRLLFQDTLMFHGSTVAVDGKAYLFTGPCGTGKSTHTRLWRELFGQRAIMVNDDMPFLQITPNSVLAYGSPWNGKHGLSTNICVPLQGICFLERGAENDIHPILPAQCNAAMRQQMHTPIDETLLNKAFSLADRLAEIVPLWQMHCNMQQSAAEVSYRAMQPEL